MQIFSMLILWQTLLLVLQLALSLLMQTLFSSNVWLLALLVITLILEIVLVYNSVHMVILQTTQQERVCNNVVTQISSMQMIIHILAQTTVLIYSLPLNLLAFIMEPVLNSVPTAILQILQQWNAFSNVQMVILVIQITILVKLPVLKTNLWILLTIFVK